MNVYFIAAACLAFIVGLIHSVLGELRIFRGLAERNLKVSEERPLLKLSHLRILRMTWHMTTLLGWAFGALLLWLSQPTSSPESSTFVEATVITAFSLASLLTLLGTRGRHLGWIGLFAVAVLVWLG